MISFKNFSFKYNNVVDKTLKNIDLTINKGEKVLIVGPSGSGKSTLSHCINGLIPFSYNGEIEGELIIDNIKPYEESLSDVSKKVGTILQDQDSQFIGLSVGEDVAFNFENNAIPLKEMKVKVIDALELVNMVDFINHSPYELSGGQKQRVSLAGVLGSDAEVLLFDEPLANLDPASGKEIMQLINDIHEKTNKTIIIVEHRIEDVLEQPFDKVNVINKGEVKGFGTPDEILKSDLLKNNGLREPLYLEAMKLAGCDISGSENLKDLTNIDEKNKEVLKNWFNNETSNKDSIIKEEKMFNTEDTYEVVIFSIGDTKAGTKMGKLQLKNTVDNSVLNCILWEETLNRFDNKIFRTGNLVRIVSASFNEKFNNCLISALELIKEAKLGLDENEIEQYWTKLQSYISKIKDEKLRQFVAELFEKHAQSFKIMPAAKLMHHNYIGGLLVHTVECAEFAELNMNKFTYKANEDEIYAACLLHDFGKIFEYTIDIETGLIDYAQGFREEWISHSQYGFCICMNAGFKKIAKMIAAHHGRAEWGAIIDLDQKDLEPELYLIHFIDNLSAKFGKISTRLLEKKEG